MSLLKWLFAGPVIRSRILKQIKLHEHVLSMLKSDKDKREVNWIIREESILNLLKGLL